MRRPRRRSNLAAALLLGGNLLAVTGLQLVLVYHFTRPAPLTGADAAPLAQPAPEPTHLLHPEPVPARAPEPAPLQVAEVAPDERATPEPTSVESVPGPVRAVAVADTPAPVAPSYQQVRAELMDVADALARLNTRLAAARRPGAEDEAAQAR